MSDIVDIADTHGETRASHRRSMRRWLIMAAATLLLMTVAIPLKVSYDCQRVLSAAEAAGGDVRVNDTWYENSYIGFWPSRTRIRIKRYLPTGMTCLDPWQQQDFFFEESAAISDDWLLEQDFSVLPCFVRIRISNPQITDVGIQSLGRIAKLETLLVPRTALTDEGLQAFSGHPHIKWLSLHETQVTAASLPVLTSMPNLTVLVVSWTNIVGDQLQQLRTLPELEYLAVDASQLTEPFVTSLSTFPKLTGLHVIAPTSIPGAPSPKLDVKHSQNVVNDALLQRLLKETTISRLWIDDGSAITDASVPALLKAGHIQQLDAWNVGMSADGAHKVNSIHRSWNRRDSAVWLPGESTVGRDDFAKRYK